MESIRRKSNRRGFVPGADDDVLDGVRGDDGVRALVLVPVIQRQRAAKGGNALRDPQARLAEITGLAQAIELDIVEQSLVTVPRPRPATLFGSGKVDEIGAAIKAHDIELAVVDHLLTPGQQRNLERAWQIKVLDRTGLILEIFGRRAQTREGTLQVELAHLEYQKSRLVRSWTHLERQRGGFGFLGGPGETQIEADRRLIQERIGTIRRDLDAVRRTRGLHRDGRKRVPYPVVALVGYTNAGKSTLFNTMTGEGVFAEDLLFATLDPTMREIHLESDRRAILSDTVGFISELPTTLIAAFRATLEEVLEADVILHVRDISHHDSEAQCADVEKVLGELGIDVQSDDISIVEVWNKIDLMDEGAADILKNKIGRADKSPVIISALSGEGIDDLRRVIDELLTRDDKELEIQLFAQHGALLSWVYDHGDVSSRAVDNDNGAVTLKVRMGQVNCEKLMARLGEFRGAEAREIDQHLET